MYEKIITLNLFADNYFLFILETLFESYFKSQK